MLLTVNTLDPLDVAATVVGDATTVVVGAVSDTGGAVVVVVVVAASIVTETCRADNARYVASLERLKLSVHVPGAIPATVRRPLPRLAEIEHTEGVDTIQSTSVVAPALPACWANARTAASEPTERAFDGNSQVFHDKSYLLVGHTLNVRLTFDAASY